MKGLRREAEVSTHIENVEIDLFKNESYELKESITLENRTVNVVLDYFVGDTECCTNI